MAVDLSKGSAGIITLSDGHKFYCMAIDPVPDVHETYEVRFESGYYPRFRAHGAPVTHASTGRVIVGFIPCPPDDPRTKELPTEISP